MEAIENQTIKKHCIIREICEYYNPDDKLCSRTGEYFNPECYKVKKLRERREE